MTNYKITYKAFFRHPLFIMIKNAKALGIVSIAGETGVLLRIEADSHFEIQKFSQEHVASAKGVLGVKLLPHSSGIIT